MAPVSIEFLNLYTKISRECSMRICRANRGGTLQTYVVKEENESR